VVLYPSTLVFNDVISFLLVLILVLKSDKSVINPAILILEILLSFIDELVIGNLFSKVFIL
jgi:hypothetical protein